MLPFTLSKSWENVNHGACQPLKPRKCSHSSPVIWQSFRVNFYILVALLFVYLILNRWLHFKFISNHLELNQWETKVLFSSGTCCSPQMSRTELSCPYPQSAYRGVTSLLPQPSDPPSKDFQTLPMINRTVQEDPGFLPLAEKNAGLLDSHCIPGCLREASPASIPPSFLSSPRMAPSVPRPGAYVGMRWVLSRFVWWYMYQFGVMGGIFSRGVEAGIGGGEAWCPSDEALLSAAVTFSLQGCICTLGKLCAPGLIGVVCAPALAQVVYVPWGGRGRSGGKVQP